MVNRRNLHPCCQQEKLSNSCPMIIAESSNVLIQPLHAPLHNSMLSELLIFECNSNLSLFKISGFVGEKKRVLGNRKYPKNEHRFRDNPGWKHYCLIRTWGGHRPGVLESTPTGFCAFFGCGSWPRVNILWKNALGSGAIFQFRQ